GAARHYHAARSKRAEAEGTDFGIAVANGNPRRVDAELLRRDLRQGGLEPLAVRLDADHQHGAAVGQDARSAALVTRDDGEVAGGVLGRATRALLGERCEAYADQPAVGLTLFLAGSHRGQIEQLGAQTDSGRIVAAVVVHPADREVRHLFSPDHVFGAYLERVAPDRPRDLVDGSLDRKTCARAADAAIGAVRRLIGRHRAAMRPVIGNRVWHLQATCRHHWL